MTVVLELPKARQCCLLSRQLVHSLFSMLLGTNLRLSVCTSLLDPNLCNEHIMAKVSYQDKDQLELVNTTPVDTVKSAFAHRKELIQNLMACKHQIRHTNYVHVAIGQQQNSDFPVRRASLIAM